MGEADGQRSDADAAAVECGERDFQALAFFAETICGGNNAIIENNFDGGRSALAHFVFVSADFEAGRVGFDEEGRDSLPGCRRIGFGEDNIEAGSGTVGDPGFCAVEFVVKAKNWKRKKQIPRFARHDNFVPATPHGGGLDARGVRTCSGSVRQKAPRISPEARRRRYLDFCCVGGVGQERQLDRGIGNAERGRHGGVNAGDFLEHQDVGDTVEGGATPLFGHQHAAAAKGAEFLDGVERKVVVRSQSLT